MRKFFKKSVKFLLIMFAGLIVIVTASNAIVIGVSQKYLFNNTKEIGEYKVGLLLGTSKSRCTGEVNLFFEYRIKAAVDLYKAGKIRYIIVSGDNRMKEYNEPRDMKAALMKRGIPEEMIWLDYAGFRTLDSVIRSKEVFGQESVIVISQKFHNERAVYIGRQKGIEAVGFNAKDVSGQFGFKTYIREVFAKVKMMLDLYVFNTQPHFLGEQIQLTDQ
ncbi:MAG: YdcF family protein [Bacteroidetes bacterium]|nr:YdcF family protein [Bacteroidota bacterium]MBU1717615.1 YdcF family protein [Bacteroidota bacterium]